VRGVIEDAPPLSIDRIDVVSAEDLSPMERVEGEALLLVSARVHVAGQPDVLLIDNLRLPARMPAAGAA
jgi:pantothenate synthetase